MLPEIEKLVIVQDRDIKIRAIRKELDQLPLEEDDVRERLAADGKKAEAAKLAAQENEVAVKHVELDIQTRRDSISRLKIQQFETRKNEEYQAMAHEIVRYGQEVSALEDKELELMEVGETLKAKLDAARAALASSQELVEEELADIAARRTNLAAEQAALEAKRAAEAAELDADLLDSYERLFGGKGGLVVVPLVEGQCKGCHMRVIKATAISVKQAKRISYCENCGRILYEGD